MVEHFFPDGTILLTKGGRILIVDTSLENEQNPRPSDGLIPAHVSFLHRGKRISSQTWISIREIAPTYRARHKL